ncbi:MAG: alpha/beta hydrolase [Chloroflexi bacterium]|nr:alpha/beta hydrolase [Chloroflexota bacterium]
MDLVLAIGLGVLLICILAGWIFARIVVYPKRFGVLESYEIEKENGKLIEAEYQSWQREEVLFRSSFGYSIYGLFFPLQGSSRSIILSHGITYTLYGSVKYMRMFRDLGFNILIYDNRFHGRSGGKNSTFGYFEKHDLALLTTWVIEKVGSPSLVGTHGESMGAAISLQHAAIDPRIDFVISDCSYSDLEELLRYRIQKDYHVGGFPFINLASVMSKVITGMAFGEVSPRQGVKQILAPVLFIHGGQDDFIPARIVQDLYDQKTHGVRKLFVPSNAAHAESFWNNQQEYAKMVADFLQENVFLKNKG